MTETQLTNEPAAALVAFFSRLPTSGAPPADEVARAFAAFVAGFDARKLPAAAQPGWERIVTRLLMAPPGPAPIPHRRITAIAAWPAARVGELIAALRAIATEVERAANDGLADETNERVSRSYL